MELLSLEINALDYVEENRKEELEKALKDLCGRDKSPEWLSQWGFPGPFFNIQDWGNVKVENLNEFEEIKVHVLLPKDLPFVYIVTISGQISRNRFEQISKGEIKIQEIRKKFEAKMETIFNRISGIVSQNKALFKFYGAKLSIVDAKKNEEAVLVGHESGVVSLIIASFKGFNAVTMPSELGRKMLESKIDNADLEQLNKIIREVEVFRNIGVNFAGLISIASLWNNYASFISQCNAVRDNLGYSHNGYAIIEFGNVKLSEPAAHFLTSSNTLTPQLSRLVILQMLIFWLRTKLIQLDDLRNRMKGLQSKAFESEWKEISKVHEELWQSESEFLKEYTFVSDAMKYVQSYLKFEKGLQKDKFYKEIALPTESLASSESGEPLALGVFDVIAGDIAGARTRVMDLYKLLKEQYSLVSINLRDKINIKLTMSNMKLQQLLVVFTLILVYLAAIPIVKDIGLFQNWLDRLTGFLLFLAAVYALYSVKWFK